MSVGTFCQGWESWGGVAEPEDLHSRLATIVQVRSYLLDSL